MGFRPSPIIPIFLTVTESSFPVKGNHSSKSSDRNVQIVLLTKLVLKSVRSVFLQFREVLAKLQLKAGNTIPDIALPEIL